MKLSDQVSASAEAAGMGGSQIYLKEGETMSVEDLLKSICIASANDAMVAMAEQISGTQEVFVERMNEKAQELKLSNTHFTNASGLHDPQHYSCASDMARIASALLQEGGEESCWPSPGHMMRISARTARRSSGWSIPTSSSGRCKGQTG
ncbi:MAG: hypothetical protein V8T10_06640 [Merdibacter sp.]